MKKIGLLFVLFIVGGLNIVLAKPVNSSDAMKVATNYYQYVGHILAVTPALAYTETVNGEAIYYIFNMSNNNGFVIVSADDATHPIIGYSNAGHYSINDVSPEFAYWMQHYRKQILYARQNNIVSEGKIALEWQNYLQPVNNNNVSSRHRISSVNPLVQTTWNQSPFYNGLCPGGSVTGCVATAMAQIMKYWNYPPKGIGSDSYEEYVYYYYQGQPVLYENYGQLAETFDTVSYLWNSMPDNLNSNNYPVSKLMLDCGISVEMDYSPSQSGAWVIDSDNIVCSQSAYVKYFGYDATTIRGYYRSDFGDSIWNAMIENELNNSRPVQYAGFSPNWSEGHTWVCDGYDTSGNFHMNWGWGGADNGYYTLDNLTPGGDNWDSGEEAVIGIMPPHVSPAFTATPTQGCKGMAVNFTDESVSNVPITGYSWSFQNGSPLFSNNANPKVTYNTPGVFEVMEIVTNSNGSDTLTKTNYIYVQPAGTFPLTEGFQEASFPPFNWYNYNPSSYNFTWEQCKYTGGYGKSSQCMYFDNWDSPGSIAGQRQMILTPEYDFTGYINPQLWFDIAYAPYNSLMSDTLSVYYSLDCGNTYNLLYMKGGMTLATADSVSSDLDYLNYDSLFIPLSKQWRTDTINLSKVAGEPNVLFAFEDRSGYGSALYIDNINIPGAPLSVNTVSTNSSANVYPDPNNGVFTIEWSVARGQSSGGTIEIYNVLGKCIYSQLSPFNPQLSIDLSSMPPGVYFYKIISDGGKPTGSGKFIIQ